MTAKHFTTAAGVFDAWADDVQRGTAPELWHPGAGFGAVELGPGLVMLLGGCPGAGKTALAMQWTVDALRTDHGLRALVANVEMSPRALLDRQLARLSGVDAGWIRNRTITGHEDRISKGLAELRRVADRLAFHTGPPTLADVALSVDACEARLLVLDYVQRFHTGAGDAMDRRAELDSVMEYARRFADKGLGVLAVSAVSRQKGKTGSNYAGLGLASYRGTSELEYGADSAWILSKDEDTDTRRGAHHLVCAKNRHGDISSLDLTFDGCRQSFGVAGFGTIPAKAPSSVPEDDMGCPLYEEDDDVF